MASLLSVLSPSAKLSISNISLESACGELSSLAEQLEKARNESDKVQLLVNQAFSLYQDIQKSTEINNVVKQLIFGRLNNLDNASVTDTDKINAILGASVLSKAIKK